MTDDTGHDEGAADDTAAVPPEPPPPPAEPATPSSGATEPIAPAEASPEEIRALQEERDRLREERDELAERARGERRSKLRTVFTVLLIIVALVALTGAMPGAFTRRTLLNEDRYVDTVSQVAEQPEVQALLATRLTAEAFRALEVESRLSDTLSGLDDRLSFLAAPITQAVEDLVRDKVEELLASPQFQRLWAEANRIAYSQIRDALDGDPSDVLQVSDGTVVINTLPLVNEALKSVSNLASELLGRQVTLPEITPDMIPSEAIERLETALGVDLPDDFGTIEVYDSDALAEVQRAVNVFDRLVVLFVVVFVLASAGAIALSQRRRRTLLQLLIGSAVVIVLERRSAIVAVDSIVDGAAEEAQAAVRAAADVLLGGFLDYTGWILAVLLVAIVVTLLTGPYRWAVWIRRGTAEIVSTAGGMVEGTEAGPTAQWVSGHRDVLMVAGAIVGVALFWWLDLSFWGFLLLVGVVGLYELAVWRTAAALTTGEEPG